MTPESPALPELLNIADHFLDARIREGKGAKTAEICGDRKLSYEDVAQLANRFANVFASLGVTPEQRVMVALPDGPEFVGALFGAIKMGAVGVMVNCHLKPDAIAAFYEYTRAPVVVVHQEHLSAFARASQDARFLKHLVIIDETDETDEATAMTHETAGAESGEVLASGESDESDESGESEQTLEHGSTMLSPSTRALPKMNSFDALAAEVSSEAETYPSHRDDAALWLFSGGTTGTPKGVVQSHGSFVNTTELYAKRVLGYCEDDITLSVPKLYFGYATGSNLFFPFAVGGTCILFPERCTADALLSQIKQHRPTILINVPTMVNHMVSHAARDTHDLSCLRLATSAGEALPTSLYDRWQEAFGVELLDGLGTAEMWHVFVSNRPNDVKPGTLGKVVPGFELRVCDDDGNPVPDGEVGWLWVRGGSRAIGYWQNKERSEEAFRGQWYVSGDMILRDSDGYYTYCGRGDDMLKVGGKWLSPKEVEGCLMQHPRVRECAVVGVTDAKGLTKPYAHVIPEGSVGDGAEALAATLKEHVRTHLEPYKAPREIVFSGDLPRTHLGKIDRGKLRRDSLPGSR
jgi:benzoate-CoA ligase family protein